METCLEKCELINFNVSVLSSDITLSAVKEIIKFHSEFDRLKKKFKKKSFVELEIKQSQQKQ